MKMREGFAARVAHTAAWTGSRMLVWGGFDGSGVTNTGGRYLRLDTFLKN